MNEQLEHIIELQQIDLKFLEKKRIIGEIPSKITKAELPLKESQKAYDKIKQRLDTLEKKKRDKERELDDIHEKIKKLKARIKEIKTNKEYQAHLKEIESVEKERYAAEDEILIVMEEIDSTSKQTGLEEEKLKTEKDKIEVLKKKLEEEMLEVEKELLPLKEKRTKIIDTIDKELYDQYMTLIESYNGVAVTEVKEEICQGCNMNIPPQLFAEIRKNEEIIHCPQCRRILYYKNST